MLKPEQLFAARKANVESLFELTNKAFEGLEKLVELNMQVAKASLGDTSEAAAAVLSVKDAQDLVALQQSLLQPAAEKAAAYSRQLYDIVASTNAALAQFSEAQTADVQKKFSEAIDNALKSAPAGTESAVSMIKSALASANTAYETANKAIKQAAEVAESNFQSMTATATKTTAKAKR